MGVTTSGLSPGTNSRQRAPLLDGIRGICAIAILSTHVAFTTIVLGSYAGSPKAGLLSWAAVGWQLGLGPFFAMSGLFLFRPFVRTTILGTPRPTLRQFYLRRAARLLPAFWLLTVICLLVFNMTLIHGVWDVVRPFVLMQVYDNHYYMGLDVSWTVAAEAQFYVVLPLIAWLMHRMARGGATPVAKAHRMLWPLGLFLLIQLGWNQYIHVAYGPWPPQFFYPLGMTGMWAVGMLMAIWAIQAEAGSPPVFYRLAAKRPNLFWLGTLAAYLICCAQPFGIGGTANWYGQPQQFCFDLEALAFSFTVVLPLVVPGASSRFMQAVLGNRPMLFLGRISYGIYLWHFAFIYITFRSGSIFGKIVPVQTVLGKYSFWEMEAITLGGAIAAAALSHYLFERPIIRLAHRISENWRAPAPVLTVVTPPRPGLEETAA